MRISSVFSCPIRRIGLGVSLENKNELGEGKLIQKPIYQATVFRASRASEGDNVTKMI